MGPRPRWRTMCVRRPRVRLYRGLPALLNRHYRGISKPGGLFTDTVVTHSPWRGAVRRNLLVLYRKFPAHKRRRGKHEP